MNRSNKHEMLSFVMGLFIGIGTMAMASGLHGTIAAIFSTPVPTTAVEAVALMIFGCLLLGLAYGAYREFRK